MSDLVSAFFVSKMSGGLPDAPRGENGEPDLFIKDGDTVIDGCGWSAVGSVPVDGIDTVVYLYTSSREVIDWMKTKTTRWGFIEEIVPTVEVVGAWAPSPLADAFAEVIEAMPETQALMAAMTEEGLHVETYADRKRKYEEEQLREAQEVVSAAEAVIIGDMPTLKARTDGLKALLSAAGCKTVDVMDWKDEAKLKRNVLDIHKISDVQYKMAGGTLE